MTDPHTPLPAYSLGEAIAHTAAKRSTIENFVRSAIVEPAQPSHGTGNPRAFNRSNLQVILLANELTRLNVTGTQLRILAGQIAEMPEWAELCTAPTQAPRPWLVLHMPDLDHPAGEAPWLIPIFLTRDRLARLPFPRACILNMGTLLAELDQSLTRE